MDLVDADASCTAPIVFDIAHLVELPFDAEIAMPLYVGLITDTGNHVRELQRPHPPRGRRSDRRRVDVDDTYRRLYETSRSRSCAGRAALEGIERHCDGRLVVSYIPPPTTPRPVPARR